MTHKTYAIISAVIAILMTMGVILFLIAAIDINNAINNDQRVSEWFGFTSTRGTLFLMSFLSIICTFGAYGYYLVYKDNMFTHKLSSGRIPIEELEDKDILDSSSMVPPDVIDDMCNYIDKYGEDNFRNVIMYGAFEAYALLYIHPQDYLRKTKHFLIIQDAFIQAYT